MILAQAPTEEFRLGNEHNRFETSFSTLEIPFINGKYLHGLDEEQRKLVERFYGKELDNPNDREFWGSLFLEARHTLTVLDMTNPLHVLTVGVLRATKELAMSYEEILDNPMTNYTFMIKDPEMDNRNKATLYTRVDDAVVLLSNINKTSKKHLKALAQYTLKNLGIDTPELAYIKLRDLIDGKLTKTQKEGLDTFEKAIAMDKVVLYATVDFRLALARNYIRQDVNKKFYNPLTNTVYGKTEEDCVSFLLKPENSDELGGATDSPAFSIRKQLLKK